MGIRYNIFKRAAKALTIDPITFGYKQIGILNWENETVTGEKYLLETGLKKILPEKSKYIFFDVGANKGHYSLSLLNNFPVAEVHAFEPLPDCYEQLSKLSKERIGRFFVNNVCVSDKPGQVELNTYQNDFTSEHASLYGDVLKDLHKASDLQKITVNALTLDAYARDHNIQHIDFLKIDTEGHELKVLEGAGDLIQNKRVTAIQFEFNEMNVISRVFFKDFYSILSPGYKFYRLLPEGLYPIPKYDTSLEVFKFQNFLAVLE